MPADGELASAGVGVDSPAGIDSAAVSDAVSGSAVADSSSGAESPVAADASDESFSGEAEFDADGDWSDGLLSGPGEESDDSADVVDDEVESAGWASAGGGMVPSADATPSAIANAPMRPTRLTFLILAPCVEGGWQR